MVHWPFVCKPLNRPAHDPSAPVGIVGVAAPVDALEARVYVAAVPAGSPVNVQMNTVPAGPLSGEHAEAPGARVAAGGGNPSYAISPSPPEGFSSVTTACPPRGMLMT